MEENYSRKTSLRNLNLILEAITLYKRKKINIHRLNYVVDGALNYIFFSSEDIKQKAHSLWMDIESATCTVDDDPKLAQSIIEKVNPLLWDLISNEINHANATEYD